MKETISIKQKKADEAILLPMGGKDAQGNAYGADNISLLKNGRRFLPIMGEFHFSRWEKEEWESAVRKMRAGGITIVATYVFWIHHEEIPGEFDFTGCRDIRSFLEVCRKLGMSVWLRIGPWVHGECRNGGFPDWLLEESGNEGYTLRSNDSKYLEHVREFWKRLSGEVRGEMASDGGPILGIQIENEYGHVGGTTDRTEGAAHMKTLKQMAQELGFVTPYYTATGWGGAHVVDGEMLPVLGGYVDAPWDTSVEEIPASSVFLFEPFHNDANIGSDSLHDEDQFTFSIHRNPYLTAELGAGLQVTGHRRTYPYPEDVESNALCMLGSGANLLGYYMYHGGINPDGKLHSLEEIPINDTKNYLPKKSYDFQTCIAESGELNQSFGALKKLHYLAEDFGERIAECTVSLPDIRPSSPEDMDTPRVAARIDGETGEGFLFINNHQRKRVMKEHEDLLVSIHMLDGSVLEIGGLHIRTDACGVIPFGLETAHGKLVATNAYLLCRFGDRTVFYTDEEDRDRIYFIWEDRDGKRVRSGADERVILLSRQDANRAYRIGDRLYIASDDSALIYEADGQILYRGRGTSAQVREYGLQEDVTSLELSLCDGAKMPQAKYSESAICKEGARTLYKEYEVKISYPADASAAEYLLSVDYLGDRAEVYDCAGSDRKLLDDWFTTGKEWHIALRRFGNPTSLVIRVYDSDNMLPNAFGDHVYFDLAVTKGCEITGTELLAVNTVMLSK